MNHKMKHKGILHRKNSFRTVPKFTRNIVETDVKSIPVCRIHQIKKKKTHKSEQFQNQISKLWKESKSIPLT